MDPVCAWLIEQEPWVRFGCRVGLMGCSGSDAQAAADRHAMVSHPWVQALVHELASWPGQPLRSHRASGHLIHKLTFLADLGIQAHDPGMEDVVGRIMAHRCRTGPFQIMTDTPRHFGGTGEIVPAWALCDAPLICYALIRFGLGEDFQVRAAVETLASLARGNGWPCAVSPELGRFRGPGRKEDPCPYATLVMLKIMALVDPNGEAARAGVDALLSLWEQSRERHAYMFFMGTDFRKLKAPFVWYDILHVLDVLSQFRWAREDPRLQSMADLVEDRRDEQGRYTPQSVWRPWEEWDFGSKRSPSPWLTFLATRALARLRGWAA